MLAPLGLGALLGASSVQTWFEQRQQMLEAHQTAQELDIQIDQLESEIERRTSAEGVRREALCFGPYVTPGSELYAIPGVSGCVTDVLTGSGFSP